MLNKDGFTLVEMSFVVVIIGILITFSMKGYTLYDTARLKTETAKFAAISEGYNTYLIRHNRPIPQLSSNGVIYDIEELENNGYIKRDTRLSILDTSQQYGIRVCDTGEYGRYEDLLWKVPTTGNPSAMSNICIYLTNIGNESVVNIDIMVMCSIEFVLDNEKFHSGKGRTGSKNPPDNISAYCDTSYSYKYPYFYAIM